MRVSAPRPLSQCSGSSWNCIILFSLRLGNRHSELIEDSCHHICVQLTSKKPTVAPFPTNANRTSSSSAPLSTGTSGSCDPYWLEDIAHQGVASFNPNPDNYTVFRNVKDFGARGDGVTDDTAAIQRAVVQGNRCGPSACESSTNTPAIVYFPEGTYLISSSIIDYYYTQVWYSLVLRQGVADICRSSATPTAYLRYWPHPTSPV